MKDFENLPLAMSKYFERNLQQHIHCDTYQPTIWSICIALYWCPGTHRLECNEIALGIYLKYQVYFGKALQLQEVNRHNRMHYLP